MAKHRQEDRRHGVTGETDIHKIQAELRQVREAEQAARDRIQRERLERQRKGQ